MFMQAKTEVVWDWNGKELRDEMIFFLIVPVLVILKLKMHFRQDNRAVLRQLLLQIHVI
jgi:hypothetical protein